MLLRNLSGDPGVAGRLPGIGLFALVLAAVLFATTLTYPASAFETEAKQVVLVDDLTGTVLLDKNPDAPMFPASMSKLMTLYVVFERLAEGSLSLEDTFRVSEKAWRMGGSKMFVEVNSRVAVGDLLRGVIVQSGNDACIVLAEGLAGSESAFADIMNQRAKAIGLRNSNFVNSTGWPHPEHVTTARDIAVLTHQIILNFSQFYPIFAEKNYTYNGIRQGNRNPLLYRYSGADGLKTGHTEASGYGLAASAVRSGRRLILVANGMESVNMRAQETERLLDYGFREFDNYRLFRAGDTVDEVEVWLGDEPNVPLVIQQDVVVTLPRKARSGLTVKILAPGPVPAPVTQGAEVAKLVVSAPETEAIELPLFAGAEVGRLSGFGRIGAAISYLVWGGGE